MRLLVLMNIESPWAQQIALRLASLGHNIHILDSINANNSTGTLNTNQHFISDDLKILENTVSSVNIFKPIHNSNYKFFQMSYKINALFKSVSADAILTLYGGGFTLAAWLSGKRPYAVYTVGSDVLFVNGVNKLISILALNSSNLVLSNGYFLAKKTSELAAKANVLPLLIGVDVCKFSPAINNSKEIKIICTRSFTPTTNNEEIIAALALMNLPDDCFKISFLSGYGELLNSTRKLADNILRSSLIPNVEFLGGVTDAQLLENVRNSHIYVSMSKSDGTSTALLEAMSCGLFPVISDIPQNREWIFDNFGIKRYKFTGI